MAATPPPSLKLSEMTRSLSPMQEDAKSGGCLTNFIKAFVRGADGSWTCVAPATWEGPPRVQVTPGARFTRGTVFMGVDLAKLLDQQHEKDQRRRR